MVIEKQGRHFGTFPRLLGLSIDRNVTGTLIYDSTAPTLLPSAFPLDPVARIGGYGMGDDPTKRSARSFAAHAHNGRPKSSSCPMILSRTVRTSMHGSARRASSCTPTAAMDQASDTTAIQYIDLEGPALSLVKFRRWTDQVWSATVVVRVVLGGGGGFDLGECV